MNLKNKYVIAFSLAVLLWSCKKEEALIPSEGLKIENMFSPPADADPAVKELYQSYNVWMRMDFKDWKEVTNAILDNDPFNRFGVEKIADQERSAAILYTKALMSGVAPKYAKSFFPLELFFVKSYGRGYFAENIKRIGRSRLVICWPNKMTDALPVLNPDRHYYQDSVLSNAIWAQLSSMITLRIPAPVKAFADAGKAYDNGAAVDKIRKEYDKDRDVEKRDAAYELLAMTGGFIEASGSSSFENDFSSWLRLLALESKENIKRKYLDNSPARAKKYEAFVAYLQSEGWDIQAMGNTYREKLDAYK
ncbi:hypothetical protein SAMN05421820_103484 [Pedobacter steynii]|uniref:Uncharacterized protein n=1 Tax=Pedobacter steynii TaxID=430522 RepID=A0A1G9S8M8_9SPHI|nr:hypothetical protein [Pedobacter steynii]NQX37529.1 hypothetical protein [Pedobacter steynii]SDM31145.1 hypothetical protein SAMN05421820_103484 [Pedobacter steynii]